MTRSASVPPISISFSDPTGERLFYIVLVALVGKRLRRGHASVRSDKHHDALRVKNLRGKRIFLFLVGAGNRSDEKN